MDTIDLTIGDVQTSSSSWKTRPLTEQFKPHNDENVDLVECG